MSAGYIVEVFTSLIVDGECDSIKVEYPARYTYSLAEQLIEYTETSDDGISMDTCVTADGDGIIVNRGNGAFVLDLRKKTGKLLYDSPAGQIPLSYITKYCRCDLDENGGKVLVSYTLDIGGVTSQNDLRITVSRAN